MIRPIAQCPLGKGHKCQRLRVQLHALIIYFMGCKMELKAAQNAGVQMIFGCPLNMETLHVVAEAMVGKTIYMHAMGKEPYANRTLGGGVFLQVIPLERYAWFFMDKALQPWTLEIVTGQVKLLYT